MSLSLLPLETFVVEKVGEESLQVKEFYKRCSCIVQVVIASRLSSIVLVFELQSARPTFCNASRITQRLQHLNWLLLPRCCC